MCQLDYPRTHDIQVAVLIHIIAVNATHCQFRPL